MGEKIVLSLAVWQIVLKHSGFKLQTFNVCFPVPVGQEIGSDLSWVFWACGLSCDWSLMLAEAVLIRRLPWGWRLWFEDGSLTWLLTGGLVPYCVGQATDGLSVLTIWQVASPRMNDERAREKKVSMPHTIYSHIVNSPYWYLLKVSPWGFLYGLVAGTPFSVQEGAWDPWLGSSDPTCLSQPDLRKT